MRYRIDIDGKYIFHEFNVSQKFNSNIWLDASLIEFEMKNIGTIELPILVFYTYYNQDGTADLARELLEDKANTLQAMESAIQEYIDSQAKNRGYDSIVSACSYAGYTNEFQTEAVSLGVWRSAVWTKAYQVQADVEAGTIPMPTVDELIAMLPIFGA